jgi:hypothetical protein
LSFVLRTNNQTNRGNALRLDHYLPRNEAVFGKPKINSSLDKRVGGGGGSGVFTVYETNSNSNNDPIPSINRNVPLLPPPTYNSNPNPSDCNDETLPSYASI